MKKQLMITMTGEDRIGIVDDVTKVVLAYHGNVESSNMARLGGEFAMLMLVSVAETQLEGLQKGLNTLQQQGFDLLMRPTKPQFAEKFSGWCSFQLNVRGADHEGIIYEITHLLAQQSVNVETMETGTEDAPFGGTVLFTMNATLLAPPDSSLIELSEQLEALGEHLNVEIEVRPLAEKGHPN